VSSPLDVERALLGRKVGESVPVTVVRADGESRIVLPLAEAKPRSLTIDERCWHELGVRVHVVAAAKVQKIQSRYRGGLLISEVRDDGPAAAQGIREGDILVGLHVWETVAADNVGYVLDKAREENLGPIKFYVLRGRETLFGHMTTDSVLR
jgi:serine protease Do